MRIKSFDIFINESLEFDEDFLQDFKDLGFNVTVYDVYYRKEEDGSYSNDYEKPDLSNNEVRGKKIYVTLPEPDSDKLNISEWIEKMKSIIEIFDVLKERVNGEFPIEFENIKFSLPLQAEDNTGKVELIKEMVNYITTELQRRTKGYDRKLELVKTEGSEKEFEIFPIMDHDIVRVKSIVNKPEFKALYKKYNPDFEMERSLAPMICTGFKRTHQVEGKNYQQRDKGLTIEF